MKPNGEWIPSMSFTHFKRCSQAHVLARFMSEGDGTQESGQLRTIFLSEKRIGREL